MFTGSNEANMEYWYFPEQLINRFNKYKLMLVLFLGDSSDYDVLEQSCGATAQRTEQSDWPGSLRWIHH